MRVTNIEKEQKYCPKCGEEHNRRGKFCSRSCANSRSWSEEDKALKRSKAKDYLSSLSKDEREKLRDRNLKNIEICLNKRPIKTSIDYILNTHFDLLSWQSKRRRVCIEQGGKCLFCSHDSWMGYPITLEIDHIDGDRSNNNRENLRGLCPNCHSTTPTWRGRKPK